MPRPPMSVAAGAARRAFDWASSGRRPSLSAKQLPEPVASAPLGRGGSGVSATIAAGTSGSATRRAARRRPPRPPRPSRPRARRVVRVAGEQVGEPVLDQRQAALLRPPPDPPVHRRGRDLDEHARLDEGTRGSPDRLHLGVPLRMSEHRRDPGGTEEKSAFGEPQRPAVVRRLDEQVAGLPPSPKRRSSSTGSRSSQSIAISPPAADVERDPGLLEPRAQLGDAVLHHARRPSASRRARAASPAITGSRRRRPRARSRGCPRACGHRRRCREGCASGDRSTAG